MRSKRFLLNVKTVRVLRVGSDKAVLRLNPPPIDRWMTLTAYGLTAAAAALGGVAYYQGVSANDRLGASDDGLDYAPVEDWLPAYDSYQSWAQVNQVSMYAERSLFNLGGHELFTDWADIGGTDDD